MLPFYFCLTVQSQLQHADRLDSVWDVYIPNSERQKRGGSNQIPHDWNGFLRDDENKTELFKFLAEQAVNLGGEKQKISTFQEQGVCNPPGL